MSEMCDLVRKFALSVFLSALLTQASYAQMADMQEFPKSSRQKAAEEREKAQEEKAQEAYEAMLKQVKPVEIPDKKFDPWGGLRAPPANQ
jgi:ribosomal protein L9